VKNLSQSKFKADSTKSGPSIHTTGHSRKTASWYTHYFIFIKDHIS